MPKPLMVVIFGAPATGKTVLARHIATELSLPLLYRDGLKETLFDSLGWSDRDWSIKLGRATFMLLFHLMDSLLAGGCSFVVESNFSPDLSAQDFRTLQAKYDFEAVQIQCVADDATRFQRFKDRAESGSRHPGHVDHTTYDEFTPTPLTTSRNFLAVEGITIELDTTDFGAVDYDNLLTTLRAAMTNALA